MRTYKEMRELAESWVTDKHTGKRVTRETAINEEVMALDVLDLLKQLGDRAYSIDHGNKMRIAAGHHGADASQWPEDIRVREFP